jgi:hypothetical protein
LSSHSPVAIAGETACETQHRRADFPLCLAEVKFCKAIELSCLNLLPERGNRLDRPQPVTTQSVCHVDLAEKAKEALQRFVQSPGPIVVGAVQGASCFGPAYEFVFILDTGPRKRRVRDRVPMTFVTAEPYIGHLGPMVSAIPRVCSKTKCASATSSGSPMPA